MTDNAAGLRWTWLLCPGLLSVRLLSCSSTCHIMLGVSVTFCFCFSAEGEDINTAKFKPDKGFSGTDYGAAGAKRGEGPVQFEKEAEDPFGLDQVPSARA